MNLPKGPGWPDMRGWAAFGFFALAGYILYMIGQNPKLLANASFMQFVGTLMSGGVLLVGSYLFGGTKTGSETMAKLGDAATTSPPADTGARGK